MAIWGKLGQGVLRERHSGLWTDDLGSVWSKVKRKVFVCWFCREPTGGQMGLELEDP